MKEKTSQYYEELLKKEYPDICQARLEKIKKMVCNIVVYEVLFALVAYGAYDYIVRNLELFNDYSIVWKGIILGIAAAIIPPLLFKTTLELITPTWAGVITNIKYEMRYPQPTGVAYRGVNRSNPQEFMKMKIETDKSKKKTLAYRSHMNSALQKGDRIVKFRGFQFPVEETESEKHYICVVCGRIVKKDVKSCPTCQHSIIDLHGAAQPKDIWAQFDYADFG